MKKLLVCTVILAGLMLTVWMIHRRLDEVPSRAPAAAGTSAQTTNTGKAVVGEVRRRQPSESAPAPPAAKSPATIAGPETGIRVAGVVVDRDELPVAGAHVVAQFQGLAQKETNSASDGSFELQIDMICNDLTLRAEKDAYESTRFGPVQLRDDGIDDIVLRVDTARSGRMAGVVVNRNNKPMPGLCVYPNRASGQLTLEPATTNDRGEFNLTNLPAGQYALVVASPHDPGARMMQSSMDVTLNEGQSLRNLRIVFGGGEQVIAGQVVNTKGEPIEGASVGIHNGFGGDQSDKDGRFTITGLEEGVFMISATHDDYTWTHVRDVSAGTTDLKVILKARGGIEGHVVSADSGEPITSFDIFHAQDPERQGYFHDRQRVTDAGGAFALSGLEIGDVTVTARAPGFAALSKTFSLEEYETITGIEMRLEPGATLEGIVKDLDGTPVPGAYLYAGKFPVRLERDSYIARSGSDGRFLIEGWSADTDQISVHHPDYAPAVADVEPGSQAEIILQDAAQIEGNITKGAKPVAAMIIMAIYQDGICPSVMSSTETDGSYRLDGLAAGTVQVIANPQRLRDGGALYEILNLDAGTVTQLDFEFKTKSAKLEGTVTINGEPVMADLMLVSHSTAGEGSKEMQTASDGYYVFEDVQAGNCALRISATTEDGQPVERNVQLTIEEEETRQQNVDISLHPNFAITGHIARRGGMRYEVAVFDDTITLPDASDSLSLLQYVNHSISTATCGEDGHFTVFGLEPGRYTLLAMQGPEMVRDPNQVQFIVAEVNLTGKEPAIMDFDFPN